MLTKERENQVVELCQKLIQQQSYSGHEDGVAGVLKEELPKLGFDSVTIDKYGNVIGCIKGKRPGKKLLFDGHIDTVPVTDETEWQYPPFAAEIHDGKIYGRGTSDMKGAVAAFVSAAANFAADTDKDFAGGRAGGDGEVQRVYRRGRAHRRTDCREEHGQGGVEPCSVVYDACTQSNTSFAGF